MGGILGMGWLRVEETLTPGGEGGLGFGYRGPYCPSGEDGGLGCWQWAPNIAELESYVLRDGVVREDFDCFPDSSWVPMLDGADELRIVPFDAVVCCVCVFDDGCFVVVSSAAVCQCS